MRSVGLTAVLVIVTVVAAMCPAFAEWEAAALGRGGTGVGITAGAFTGYANPAALSVQDWCITYGDRPLENPDAPWVGQLSYTYDLENDEQYDAFMFAGTKTDEPYGVGAGFIEWKGYGDSETKIFGSYGRRFHYKGDDCGWSWGASVAQNEVGPAGPEKVTLDAGLYFQNPSNLFGQAGKYSLGVVARDVTDEFDFWAGSGTRFDIGGGITFGRKARLSLDVFDLLDDTEIPGQASDTGSQINFGLEYKFCPTFIGRVGSLDDDTTFGLSVRHNRLRVDWGRLDYDQQGVEDLDLLDVRYIATF